MFACETEEHRPSKSRKRKGRKGGGIEAGGREHALNSASACYQWQSSSTIAINQARSPPHFVITNQLPQDNSPGPYWPLTTTVIHDMVMPRHRLLNECPLRRGPNSAQCHVGVTTRHVNGPLRTCHDIYQWRSTPLTPSTAATTMTPPISLSTPDTHADGRHNVMVDDDDTTQQRTMTAQHDATRNDHEVTRRRVHHCLLLLLLYDHCCCSWLYQVVISVLIIPVRLLV
jgi:hypothetical protein